MNYFSKFIENLKLDLWDDGAIIILKIIIIFILSALAYRIYIYIINRFRVKWDLDLTFISVLNEIVKYIIILTGISFILALFGIDLNAILVSFGVVGVALGFASKDIVSNLISGLFILLDKSFKVGDSIEINNQKGKVEKLGLRTTQIITEDNSQITIPNSSFSKTTYINHTSTTDRRVNLDVILPYSYDLKKFEDDVFDIISTFDWVSDYKEPEIILKELTDTGMHCTIHIWTANPWKVEKYKSALAKKVQNLLYEI
jgi:small conductance mechanosensitive channel